ncbi:MAG TPA: phosphate ABC transporter permease subunit PstC [Candidatus Baltobacteraceae bacterium]|nr:phosphate ABC transporter permease subunit PstC [Candidatus Baltobacteraceae bacterium]
MTTGLPYLQRRPAQFLFRYGFGAAALITALLMVLMLVFLVVFAFPAIKFNGWNILTGITWNIGNQYGSGVVTHNGVSAQPGASFGGLVFIFGTIITSALAMVLGVPISILVALALVYRIPRRIKPLANAAVELMAGVPSVVYGLWGLVVLVPWIGQRFGPFVTGHVGKLPVFGGEPGSGNGLLASGVILAIMVIPIMVATMRDVILAQSSSIFEASMALGSTSWQAVIRAVIPSVRSGMMASVLVALGRALGETMAVLMVSGAAVNQFPSNIFQAVNTIAAVIVSQLDSALTDASGMAQRSLAELAVVLFLITLIVNSIARAILHGADRVRESR